MILKKILKFILEFLFGDSPSKSWDIHILKDNLKKYSDYKQYPYLTYLPHAIHFSAHFWEEVKNLSALTLQDEHERAVSAYYTAGDLILTKHIRGERHRVVSSHVVRLRYIPNKGTPYFTKEIVVNGSVYSSQSVHQSNIPNNIVVRYLFNMHTHPPHYYNNSSQAVDRYYNFFSLTDIKTFVSSSAVMTALITDELWVLFKTATSPKTVINYQEKDISPQSLYKNFSFGIYKGSFDSGEITLLYPKK